MELATKGSPIQGKPITGILIGRIKFPTVCICSFEAIENIVRIVKPTFFIWGGIGFRHAKDEDTFRSVFRNHFKRVICHVTGTQLFECNGESDGFAETVNFIQEFQQSLKARKQFLMARRT